MKWHEIHLDTGAILRVKARNIRITYAGPALRGIEWEDADANAYPLWVNVDRIVAVMVVPK